MERSNRIFKHLFSLQFTYWWIVSLFSLLLFDLLWMAQTTFRPFTFFAFYPFLLLFTTLLSFPSVITRRSWLQVVVLLGANIVMIANLMYCRTYYNAIPFHSYALVGNLADFKESVADSFQWYFLFLPFLTLAAWFIFEGCVKNTVSRRVKRTDGGPYVAMLLVFGIISWGCDIPNGNAMKRISQMEFSYNYATCIVPVYGLPLYLFHDYGKTSSKITPEELERVKGWLTFQKQTTDPYFNDSTYYRPVKKNLVVILSESLESWPIGLTVEGVELTPYMNSLLKDSTTFYAPHVLTQAGAGRSIDGQLLVLTGMLPMKNLVYSFYAPDNKFYSLQKAMSEKGGRSYLITGDKPYVWNQKRVADAFGIDTIIHKENFVMDEVAGPSRHISDGSLFRQVVEKMKKGEIWPQGENAMITMVTYTGHNPYNLPDKLRRIKLNGKYADVIKNFMITANYDDYALSNIIEYLKSRPDWDETLVVITGDHEALAVDRKEAVTNPASRPFVDPHQHTPLIILNSPVGGRFDKEMAQADIYSTIIDLMGWKEYEWKGMGRSVLDPGFTGFAVGNAEETGVASQVDSTMLKHLRDAREISDLILRYDLLK